MPTKQDIIDILMTVFDPEFPLIDVWTMGLIYEIEILWPEPKDETYEWYIDIDMTFTTPACPAIDILPESIKNAINRAYPTHQVNLNTVRDPLWTINMLKDEDLRKMFE